MSDIYISDHVIPDSLHLDPVLQDIAHRQAWERGDIDYRGRDKFENIQKKIQESIGVLRDPTDTPLFLF